MPTFISFTILTDGQKPYQVHRTASDQEFRTQSQTLQLCPFLARLHLEEEKIAEEQCLETTHPATFQPEATKGVVKQHSMHREK
jgi:hypothetical protein